MHGKLWSHRSGQRCPVQQSRLCNCMGNHCVRTRYIAADAWCNRLVDLAAEYEHPPETCKLAAFRSVANEIENACSSTEADPYGLVSGHGNWNSTSGCYNVGMGRPVSWRATKLAGGTTPELTRRRRGSAAIATAARCSGTAPSCNCGTEPRCNGPRFCSQPCSTSWRTIATEEGFAGADNWCRSRSPRSCKYDEHGRPPGSWEPTDARLDRWMPQPGWTMFDDLGRQ
jgi:hypothetical protein